MTPEGRVKAKVVLALKASGHWYTYSTTHGYGRSGIPDLLCCVGGRFVAIECKANGNTPTPLQKRELDRIQLAGGAAFVVDETNVDEVSTWLKNQKS